MAKLNRGPYYWDFLNLMVETNKTNLTFRIALKEYIPCPGCQAHYRAFFTEHRNLALKNPKGFVLALHNHVNEGNKKKVWTAEEYETYTFDRYWKDNDME